MRVFVTGATGFVGTAVVKELINAGHEVLGLARTEAAAQALLSVGAKVHRGDLTDLESLRNGATLSDGVIHTGFIHDFSKFKEMCEVDRVAIEAIGSALAGTNKPFIITSGIGILTTVNGLLNEQDRAVNTVNPRVVTEAAADNVAAGGIRVSVVRLPPSVHGKGDHGFVPILINIAKEKGISVYKGEGLNRWPAVHRVDAAHLYRLALEKNADPGTRFHAVAEEGIAFRDIAETIGRQLNVPVVSKSPEEAAAHFTWFTHFSGMDCAASAKQTQQVLNWHPSQPGLIKDVESNYFGA